MSLAVVFKAQAEVDLAEAHDWYEQQQFALGKKFLIAVNTAAVRLAAGPERFPIVHKKVCRALVRGFPFSIYFIVERNRIFILTVVHQRRDPKLWKSREGN